MTLRLAGLLACAALVVAACDVTTGGEPILLDDTTIPSIELQQTTSTDQPDTAATDDAVADDVNEPPLLDNACARFDVEQLADMTAMPVPLTLIGDDAGPDRVQCSFVAAAGGRDASVTILIEPTAAHPDGFFRTAGEFETELDVGGVPGVGIGRGILRAQIDDSLGMTLTVGLRTLSSDAAAFTDKEHLDIRDAVAAYLVSQLVA